MTLITTYTGNGSHATTYRRRPSFGITHNAPQWRAAAAVLRVAIRNAVACAKPSRRNCSPDSVADAVIDVISRLDVCQLHTLAIIIGMLERTSRNNNA